jgi:hypothetical protein
VCGLVERLVNSVVRRPGGERKVGQSHHPQEVGRSGPLRKASRRGAKAIFMIC